MACTASRHITKVGQSTFLQISMTPTHNCLHFSKCAVQLREIPCRSLPRKPIKLSDSCVTLLASVLNQLKSVSFSKVEINVAVSFCRTTKNFSCLIFKKFFIQMTEKFGARQFRQLANLSTASLEICDLADIKRPDYYL
jgi:hypothetical protein